MDQAFQCEAAQSLPIDLQCRPKMTKRANSSLSRSSRQPSFRRVRPKLAKLFSSNEATQLRMNLSLADSQSGRILCSRVVEGCRDDVLKLTREVAEAVQEALRAEPHDRTLRPVAARKRGLG